jgi:copper(I)-binding protein
MLRNPILKGITMRHALFLALMGCFLATPTQADTVKIKNAWVRATAPGQSVAGGFLDLTADADMKLVGGSSPVCDTLQLHIMKMDNGVMEMRQVEAIDLPKGQTVHLQPGGLHLMFIDLKHQVRPGDKVPIDLTVRDAAGREQHLQVVAPALRGRMGPH